MTCLVLHGWHSSMVGRLSVQLLSQVLRGCKPSDSCCGLHLNRSIQRKIHTAGMQEETTVFTWHTKLHTRHTAKICTSPGPGLASKLGQLLVIPPSRGITTHTIPRGSQLLPASTYRLILQCHYSDPCDAVPAPCYRCCADVMRLIRIISIDAKRKLVVKICAEKVEWAT